MWIRRLGMGDFEYRVEPWGRDEVSKACLALETLRQNSIRAMQLDTVQRLSDELHQKNEELERALVELRHKPGPDHQSAEAGGTGRVVVRGGA